MPSTFRPTEGKLHHHRCVQYRINTTLWQKEGETFRPVAFASRFLTDCEKKYAINELELLGALWGLEYFRDFVYGK